MTSVKIRPFAGALALCCCIAAAQAKEPNQPFYTYQNQPIPLLVDTSRVAVFLAAGGERGAEEGKIALVERLAAHGAVAIEEGPRAEWTYVTVPAARGVGDEAAANFAAELAADEAIDFVSPVYMDEHGPRLVQRDILIGFHNDITHAEAEGVIEALGLGQVLARDWENIPGAYRVRTTLKNGAAVLDLANVLAVRPEVEWAEPDMVFSATLHLIPNDPSFSSQWHLRQANDIDMDADEAWDITTGNSAIITAVFDTGTQLDHYDLNLAPGADFTNNGSNGGPATTCDNHGTAVAGCISAVINNSAGVVGVAPGTRVAPVKTLTIASQAPCPNSGTGSDFAAAINWSRTNGCKVTNASLGFGQSGAIDAAYTTARNAGLVHFASTGNDGAGTIGYPSSSPSVNSVGSINTNGARSSFSNFGTGIDFVAPGAGIWTTDRTGSSGYSGSDITNISGTSFSSPNAAGVAALIFSVNAFLSPAQVENIMQTTAMDLGSAGYDTQYGFGLVNARASLLATPPPTPPGAFNLSTPSNGATQVSRLPSLTWTQSNFATNYELTIDDNADFSSPVHIENQSGNSFTYTGTPLNHSTTYFWRVISSNALGMTSSTPTSYSFTTISIPPSTFPLVSPANGATGQSLTPTLDWDPASLAETYTVQVDNDSDFSSPVLNSNTSATFFGVFSALSPGTLYHWRVFANNPLGSTLCTPSSRSFTTINTPPLAFNLQSPADGSTVTTFTPTLNWSDSVSHDSYRIQVDDLQTFASPEVNQTGLTASDFTIPAGALTNNIRYYWRVFAVNSVGETASTPAVYNFALIVPTCCPGNADKVEPGTVTFSDVTTVLANWGNTYPNGDGAGDSDCNAVVNFADVTSTLANFNNICN